MDVSAPHRYDWGRHANAKARGSKLHKDVNAQGSARYAYGRLAFEYTDADTELFPDASDFNIVQEAVLLCHRQLKMLSIDEIDFWLSCVQEI